MTDDKIDEADDNQLSSKLLMTSELAINDKIHHSTCAIANTSMKLVAAR